MAASVPLRRTWQRAAVLLSRGRLAKIAGWRTKRASLQLTCPTAVSGGYKRYIYTFSQVKSKFKFKFKFFFIYGGYIHAEECTVQDSTVIINE